MSVSRAVKTGVLATKAQAKILGRWLSIARGVANADLRFREQYSSTQGYFLHRAVAIFRYASLTGTPPHRLESQLRGDDRAKLVSSMKSSGCWVEMKSDHQVQVEEWLKERDAFLSSQGIELSLKRPNKPKRFTKDSADKYQKDLKQYEEAKSRRDEAIREFKSQKPKPRKPTGELNPDCLYSITSYLRDNGEDWIGDLPNGARIYKAQDRNAAWNNFYAGRSRPPKIKPKGSRESIAFKGPRIDGPKITSIEGLNKAEQQLLGVLQLAEPIGERLDAMSVAPKTVAFSCEAGQLFVSFPLPESPDPAVRAKPTRGVVGIDVGCGCLVCSDGVVYWVPQRVLQLEKQIANLQRKLSRMRWKGLPRDHKSKRAQVVVNRIRKKHAEKARVLKEWQHRVTTHLVTTCSAVVLEDLDIQAMTQSAKGSEQNPGKNVRSKAGLNRAMLRAGPGEVRRQIAYKCLWYGRKLWIADRFYASSQTCSSCGCRREDKLKLKDRSFTCLNSECRTTLDRDVNAARNLRNEVLAGSEWVRLEVPVHSAGLRACEREDEIGG